jgi:NTP pyrophosphatase (non-canonical NTP hydrolase)
MNHLDLIQHALNELSELVYKNAVEKGFHDKNASRSLVDNYAVWTTNIHGEVSELWEAARKGSLEKPCDKERTDHCDVDCDLTCEEEELADIVIRALDTAKARNIDIGRAVLTKHEYNQSRPHMHGGKLA